MRQHEAPRTQPLLQSELKTNSHITIRHLVFWSVQICFSHDRATAPPRAHKTVKIVAACREDRGGGACIQTRNAADLTMSFALQLDAAALESSGGSRDMSSVSESHCCRAYLATTTGFRDPQQWVGIRFAHKIVGMQRCSLAVIKSASASH